MFKKKCNACLIDILPKVHIYYSCDQIHCSKSCANTALLRILKKDNQFKYPQLWKYYMKK